MAHAGHPDLYAYYPGVDTVAHEFGLAPPYLDAELQFVDGLVGRFRDALPPEAALLVTADHGQMEVGDIGRNSPPSSTSSTDAAARDGSGG